MCQSRSKSLEKQGEDTITPALVELSKRMSEPPADVKKGLLISAFLPGIGAVYQGDTPKGTGYSSKRSCSAYSPY